MTLAPDKRRSFPHAAVAAAAVFGIQFVHGTADAFVYDAGQYWAAATALVQGQDAITAGVLELRGVLSAIIYVPPALVTSLIGPTSAPWTVLVWNAMLASTLCVWLLPRLAGVLTPGDQRARIWVSALTGGIVISGFARYPLLDVWAVGIALTSILLLASGRRWWVGILAGFSLVVATNLRPAYIAPLLIAAGILLFSRFPFVLWSLPGALLALLPQAALNSLAFGRLSITPVQTDYLVTVQSTYASFTTRYDTVLAPDRYPSQFYCDPSYARLLLADEAPNGPLGVLLSAIRHLPEGLWFLTQKVAASLQWSFASPYEHPPGPGTSLMAVGVVGVAAAGLVSLCWSTRTVWRDRSRRLASLALLGFWCGAVATLALSTPETRFALPIILIGLVGLMSLIPEDLSAIRPSRTVAVGALVAVAIAAALFFAGKVALQHPLPAGHVPDVSSCAFTDE